MANPSLGVELDCGFCDGQGWYVGHEDECYEHGCVCGGVQADCGECRGTGKRLFEEDRNDGIEAPYGPF